jgi:hypothetical protein
VGLPAAVPAVVPAVPPVAAEPAVEAAPPEETVGVEAVEMDGPADVDDVALEAVEVVVVAPVEEAEGVGAPAAGRPGSDKSM